MAYVEHGMLMYVQRAEQEYVTFKYRVYHNEGGQWYEQTTICKVLASEVPADILDNANSEEKDMTEDVVKVMKLDIDV